MSTAAVIDGYLLSTRKKVDTKFEKFVEDVLLANNRTALLSANEIAFLRNRHKEGKSPENVTI